MKTFTIDNTVVKIADKDYLACGGEASIYIHGDLAIKIYSDPAKAMSLKKIEELQRINNKNVLFPKHIVLEKGKPVGYAMDFQKNSEPICKLFANSFKNSNNIDNEKVNGIVGNIRSTLLDIHKAKCLVVDLNEMNLLVASNFSDVYFIDSDSYQTPSFKATAIMESIRDPLIKNNEFNQFSDWFSFAIIAFQLWVGIHPYKGRHPDYSMKDWKLRMENGASVFDKGVSLPGSCNNLDVIPKNYAEWMKDIFRNAKRTSPPDSFSNLMANITLDIGSKIAFYNFDVKSMFSVGDDIVKVYSYYGNKYVCTRYDIYQEDKKIYESKFPYQLGFLNDELIIVEKVDSVFKLRTLDKDIAEIVADGVFVSEGRIFSVIGENLYENLIHKFGKKNIHSVNVICNLSPYASKILDGFVVQDLMGKININIPYGGGCSFIHVKELDGHRIVSGKYENRCCVIVSERLGVFYNHILMINSQFDSYSYSVEKDVQFQEPNFTVNPNGMVIRQNDSEIEIFNDKAKRTVSNSPVRGGDILFNSCGKVYFSSGKEIKRFSLKSS